MKVFIVINHAIWDCEDFGIEVQVFESKEKAKNAFDELVKEEKEIAEKHGFKIDDDVEDHFLSFKEGCSSETHSEVEIRELTLN